MRIYQERKMIDLLCKILDFSNKTLERCEDTSKAVRDGRVGQYVREIGEEFDIVSVLNSVPSVLNRYLVFSFWYLYGTGSSRILHEMLVTTVPILIPNILIFRDRDWYRYHLKFILTVKYNPQH